MLLPALEAPNTGRFALAKAVATKLKRRLHTVKLETDVGDVDLLSLINMKDSSESLLVIKNAEILLRSMRDEVLKNMEDLFTGYLAQESLMCLFIFDSDESDGIEDIEHMFDCSWRTRHMQQEEIQKMSNWADTVAKMPSRNMVEMLTKHKIGNIRSGVLHKWLGSLHQTSCVEEGDFKRLERMLNRNTRSNLLVQ